MRGRGISYDTGFINAGVSTREHFDPDLVRREMRVIREDLHCTAVRVTGGDPDRLEIAARHAADAGLEVWYSPFTCGLTIDELLALLADCAERAERLRRGGAEVVFLTGSELSLFNVGFLPGDSLEERLALMTEPDRLREALPALPARINDFLGKAVAAVRERFGGKVGYASLPFEGVDWAPFDVIASDAGGYRTPEIAAGFRDAVRAFAAQGKPAVITEFGCATFTGAADLGGRGDSIIEWGPDGRPLRVRGHHTRDEQEQVTYLRELLDIYEAEGVDSVFWTSFARYDMPHREDPERDLDLGSYGVVKVLDGRLGETYPDMPWEPKAAFTALADRYRG
ncbi:hypothetical protein ACFY05_37780 [Microtetraspora fusca]|uniref:Abortive infection protein n=1 Tax=Microtetraspora fusca TaxID=1997 RepID=A0ABW6VHL2_MICFU